MNGETWKTCDDPIRMLKSLRGKAAARSLALFAVAACRRDSDLMDDERSCLAVEWSERAIEGLANWDDGPDDGDCYLMAAAANRCMAVAGSLLKKDNADAERWACEVAELLLEEEEENYESLASLIREVFGNPFRSVSLNPAWLTPDVLSLARGIYEERTFDRMPILADALQDAGCTNDDILNHCREENHTHVRGCWVVDLLLGKT